MEGNGVAKILVLAANPDGDRLRVDTEAREIREAIQLGTRRDRFELHTREDVRWRDLSGAIVALKPAIIHFCGHGDDNGIILADGAGASSRRIPLTALAALLQNGFGTRLVLFNACHTERQAAPLRDVVDHVISMTAGISDPGALEFARGFYQTLACGHGITTSFGAARAGLVAFAPTPEDPNQPKHHRREGADEAIVGERDLPRDTVLLVLLAIKTKDNVYPRLPRDLVEQLSSAFSDTNQVVDIVQRAEVLIQQAGDQIPEPFRGYRLTVGRVPLQAGAYHAWGAAIRDAAAISPYALMALLLVAREQRPNIKAINRSVELVSSLDN